MPKIRRSISTDKSLMDYINQQIECKRFKDVSHAIEFAVYQLKQNESKNK